MESILFLLAILESVQCVFGISNLVNLRLQVTP